MKKQSVHILLLALLSFCTWSSLHATIRYVKEGGAGDGSSWTNASGNLQAMINASGAGDQVWVAAGTYKPTTGTERNYIFAMKNGVAIYGGFPNTGTPGMGDRNWATHVTTLSGDIGTVGNNSDNSYNVINNSGLNSTAVLDGFTVTGGNGYEGCGMRNFYASPTVTNCIFSGNTAINYGGGMCNIGSSSSTTVTNCIFSGNSAPKGGGMYNSDNSSPQVTNCSFSGNSAPQGGGMFNNNSSSPTVTNCILWGNSSGISNSSSSPTVTYSIVQGGYTGTGNLNADPLFVSASDLHLQACSPAIDAGNNAAVPSGVTTDLDGNPRFFNSGVVDMGAYEFQSNPTPVIAACQGQTVSLNGTGAATLAASALDNGSSGCGALTFTVGGSTSLSFTCADIGPHTLTLTVTDNRGQMATCLATVTVQDNQVPTITCPTGSPFSRNTDLNGCHYTVQGTEFNATFGDNCSGATLKNDFNNSNTLANANLPKGPTTIKWTVTDAALLSATCQIVVNVTDNEKPTITCPNPVTVTCASQVPPVNLAAVTASDNCDVPIKSHVGDVTSNMTCANRKTITRTYKATDGSNNSATCAQVITVYDDVKPVFTSVPANVTVVCPNPLPALGTPAATDGCGSTVTVTYNGQTRTDGNCATNYTMTRQWTASDVCGNTQTATQKITVLDLTAPVFTSVPANVTVQCNAIPPVGNPTATDGCGGTAMISYNGQTRTNGSCADNYTLTRQWTASDGCNTRTATQKITVVDTQKPAFTFVPVPVTIECSDPVPPVGSPTATDNCDATVTITLLGQYTTAATAPNVYLLVRVWKATDNCSNYVTASQVITVQDTQKPVFTSVPAPITIECSDLFPVTPGTATASDNCDASVQVSFSGQTSAPGNCPQSYVVTRVWTAYDDYGNTQLATQTITVVDTKAPVFTNAPANVTIACGAGIPPVPVVTASDACDNSAPVTYLGEVNTGPNCPYTVTRTWTVADDCGNATTYIQVITVSGQPFNGSGANAQPATHNPQPVTRNPQSIALQLAPNPAEDEVWASFDVSADGDVSIFLLSLDGRLVMQQQFPAFAGANRLRLDLSGMAAGVYVVRLNAGGQMAAEKLVVFRN